MKQVVSKSNPELQSLVAHLDPGGMFCRLACNQGPVLEGREEENRDLWGPRWYRLNTFIATISLGLIPTDTTTEMQETQYIQSNAPRESDGQKVAQIPKRTVELA